MYVRLSIVLVLSVLSAASCGSAASVEVSELPVEYKLAVIHSADSALDRHHPLVDEFRVLLNDIQSKTINDRERIADICVYSQKMLTQERVPMSLLDVMRALSASIPTEAVNSKLDLSEIAAAFVTTVTAK